ncbi:phage protease [Dasania sp. GY-MA-18]|uniref:Phage protease n=1 Tax=Dasania phycosphaerae TaxID=2950436 RepID=A0A9J6RKY3_9GAMM|nr:MULTISPECIES: phage protease [Dasania]MCR8922654.1 phage protease [Dasania sp. GY-MA-18]MCZ0865084.1 phage protease [Dasania phycosphaerae]MCZ0868810.1 phage protease [Dasania phycosphaerae]
MRKNHTVIALSDGSNRKSRRVISTEIQLAEGASNSVVDITRTGTFSHPRYGRFSITLAMLQSMVKNFEARTFGQDIMLDVAHDGNGKGAGGTFTRLFISPRGAGHVLQGEVEWLANGIDAVTNKGYKYLSIEYIDNYIDAEFEQEHGPTMLGAALVVRGHIKNLQKVQLAEAEGNHLTVLDNCLQHLQEGSTMKFAKLLAELKTKLMGFNLSEPVLSAVYALAELSLSHCTEEAQALLLVDAFVDNGKKLGGSNAESVDLSELTNAISALGKAGDSKALTEESLNDLLDRRDKEREQAAKKLADTTAGNIKRFSELVDAAEGLEESDRKELKDAVKDLITAEMTEGQITSLAELQITQRNALVAARKLSEMGVTLGSGPMGSVQLADAAGDSGSKVETFLREKLKHTRAYQSNQIKLSEKVSPFVSDVLALYDAQHAGAMHSMAKTLSAGGASNISDTDLPVGYQREVIRETLSDLNILQLVATFVDPSATATTQIPYTVRDVSNITNYAITPERGAIAKAGISQKMAYAYIQAMKIAIDVSNEVMHFTRSSGINFDAFAESLATASRFMRELICQRLANEIQRNADAYQAIDVPAENVSSQLDGSNSLITTANFPIVRQHTTVDLQGNTIGNTENPIAITINSVPVEPWDGTGTQSAGTYYRIANYNLGYIELVDQLGDPATPANTGTNTVGYSYATNLLKVDSDLPANTTRTKHLNTLIQAVGAAKAQMSQQRFVQPEFLLMSSILNNECTDAEQYTAAGQRNDSRVSVAGDLEAVKNIPAVGTNAPGIDLGDERIILGQTNTLAYTIAKPFSMGEVQEARNSQGQLIGAKEQYGEEYNALKVPEPLRNRFMSILYYSAAGR